MMLDNKRASQKLKDELFLSKEKKIEIIKFQDENWAEYNTKNKSNSLLHSQKIYIMIAGILQLGLIVFFFYRRLYLANQTHE